MELTAKITIVAVFPEEIIKKDGTKYVKNNLTYMQYDGRIVGQMSVSESLYNKCSPGLNAIAYFKESEFDGRKYNKLVDIVPQGK